jgi:signal transduction histidine kinase
MWEIPYIYFLILCAVFVFCVMSVACCLRQWMIARAIRVHFDERLAERIRIARDLQDSMLQTVQSCKLITDDALDKSNDSVHMRLALEKLSGWLGQAMQEGQAALNALRTATAETNDHKSNRSL